MRAARKGPCVTIDPPVRDVPYYGEIEYGWVEGWDVMGREREVGEVIRSEHADRQMADGMVVEVEME
jgi:hypothetical protein